MIAGFTLINAFNWFKSSLVAQIASAVLAVFGVYFLVDARGQSKGYQQRDKQVHQQNAKATEIGSAAARKSGNPAPRGVRRLDGYR